MPAAFVPMHAVFVDPAPSGLTFFAGLVEGCSDAGVHVARVMAIQIANATFAVRRQQVWGAGSSAVASDSTHFGAFDQNIFTEWHSRYGGRGVLIYWHVERKSMAIQSQVINCSASEVAAMIEGAMRHGTSMEVDGNYVDSHGQSGVGFALTRLLGSTCYQGSSGSTW